MKSTIKFSDEIHNTFICKPWLSLISLARNKFINVFFFLFLIAFLHFRFKKIRVLTLLTYPLLIFQQLCPFNRDKISSFLIRVLKFHDFY